MLSSGVLVTDTQLEILNTALYDRVPDYPANAKLPSFVHVMVANRIARTGTQWVSLFSERNTGTGSNAQWLIVDYNAFQRGEPLKAGAFYVIESVPGLVVKEDRTQHLLNNGWWASYNRPHFARVREETGHNAAVQKYGILFSSEENPRAQIFQQLAPAIDSLADMRALMRENRWPNEKFAGALSNGFTNHPGHAISARFDLDSVSRLPCGGIDAKVTSRCLFRQLHAQAISGPTHLEQQPFRWDSGKAFPGWPHLGLPDKWDFSWVQMTPDGSLNATLKDTSRGCLGPITTE
jgi:hypothetical protein